MKPIAPQRVETGAAAAGIHADGLIRISAGDNGPNIQSRAQKPDQCLFAAVAAAGVLQALSNFKFATVNSVVYKLFEFEPYSAEYWR